MNESPHTSGAGGIFRGIQEKPEVTHRNLSPKIPTSGLSVDLDFNHRSLDAPTKSPTDSFVTELPFLNSFTVHRRPASGFLKKGLGGANLPWPSRSMVLIAQFVAMYILAYMTIYMTSSIPQTDLPTLSVRRASTGQNASHSLFLLQPPTCRLDAEAVMDAAGTGDTHTLKGQQVNVSALPLVFFFAGVEGSGHKFFEQVFRNLPVNFSVVAFEPGLHLSYDENQTNVHPRLAANFSMCYKLPYARPLREYAFELSHRLAKAGPGPYVRARDSYPLGRVRTALARPDLVSLHQLDGLMIRLKVVVLLRDLGDAVRSATRMGYHGGDVGLQVRMVEDNMVYLDSSIRMLPCGSYLVLDFDWIVEEPEVAAGQIAEFIGLGVTPSDVVEAIIGARHTKPAHTFKSPLFGSQSLDEFFALRADMWPMLSASRGAPYFHPKHPSDWPFESINVTQLRRARKGTTDLDLI